MGRNKRNFRKDLCYHLYNRGNRKNEIFRTTEDFETFKNIFLFCANKRGIEVISYCLMKNHFHLLVRESFGIIPVFMHDTSTKYSKYFNQTHKYVGHVFQGRYCSREVLNAEYFEKLIDYIRQNPVKAGLVQDFKYYRWYGENNYLLKKQHNYYKKLLKLYQNESSTEEDTSIFIDLGIEIK